MAMAVVSVSIVRFLCALSARRGASSLKQTRPCVQHVILRAALATPLSAHG